MGKLQRPTIAGMGIFLLAILLFACQKNKKAEQVREDIQLDTVWEQEPVLKYGIPVDSFIVEEGVVKPNQYLGQILNGKGVSMAVIDKIAKLSKKVFDVRKIKSGKNYTFFLAPDSLRTPRYFVYENSPVEYVVYQLYDSLDVRPGEKDIQTRLCTAQGVVESSLWNTVIDNDLHPVLSMELEDIYAWTIDFFAIQKGDRFRVIYEEEFVDSVSIGIGTIHAVQFDHFGEENYAFRYSLNDTLSFFDENGKSLQKAFLKAPLRFSRVSSRFSHSRMHPVLRIRRPHRGVDYAAPTGTPVRSIGDGTVVARAYQRGGGGNYIKIKHNSVYTTTYMHLSKFARGITTGKRVKQGQVIGYVGSTGLASGPHLDFRVSRSGMLVDPLKVKSPPGKSIPESGLAQYNIVRDSLLNELGRIEWEGMLVLSD